ncbi:MAG: zinc peptidase, partial [bacterium]|nr:zinc peptidase [bacterium]
KELEIDTKPKIVNATINDDPSLIAKKEREKIRISIAEQIEWQNAYEAFNFWRTTIESKNIFVFQFKFPLEDARGFSLMDKEPAVIVINQNDN